LLSGLPNIAKYHVYQALLQIAARHSAATRIILPYDLAGQSNLKGC
jgi:hypothetical protein